MMEIEIGWMLRSIYYALGVAVLVMLLGYMVRKQILTCPCDSCKYIALKGGGPWKYTCDRALFGRHFDKPPKYCANWAARDADTNGGDHDA